MKQLYVCRTQDGYVIVVSAKDADEAEKLANQWFFDNISSINNPNIDWIIELCDNDEIIEMHYGYRLFDKKKGE